MVDKITKQIVDKLYGSDEPAQVRYTYGYNNRGHDGLWSVLKVTDEDRGAEVVLSGKDLTEAKAKANALILNAPELY